MKPLVHAIVVLIALAGGVSAASWDSVGQAWQQYLQNPTTENAAILYNTLPADTGELSIDTDTLDILDSIYDSLGVLGYQIEASDTNAVRVGFRLYAIAAGDFGESLDIILGELIRIDPQLFLHELKNHRGIVPSIQGLVANLGPNFSDSEEVALHELKLRVRALESVTESNLVDVRDECIAASKEAEGLGESPEDQ